MDKKEIIRLLINSTYQLWYLSLQGTQETSRIFNKMKNIRKGDIVLEISSINCYKDYENSLGILVDQGFNNGTIYTIKKLYDDKEITWSNCQFIRVPCGDIVCKAFERKNKEKE